MKTSIFDHDGILSGQDCGEISNWALPGLVRDLWIEGDDDQRREIDQRLEKMRQRQYDDQWTMFRY